METLPKPSSFFVVVSVLVILVCLGFISILLAALSLLREPCLRVLLALLLAIPVLLAIEQYRAAFQRDSGAAAVSAGLLFILAGIAPFLGLFSVGMLWAAGQPADWLNTALVVCGLLSVFGLAPGSFFAGWMNYRWDHALPAGDGSRPWVQFSLRELFGLITAAALCSAMTAVAINAFTPDYVEHVGPADAPIRLPSAAVDVCFGHRSDGTLLLEFTTTELEFRRWAAFGIGPPEGQEAQIPVSPIFQGVAIERYKACSPVTSGSTTVVVDDGLYFAWANGRQKVWAIFDAMTNRAYYAGRGS